MPFSKGDPNINRNGRPKKGYALRDFLRERLEIQDVQYGYDKIKRKEALIERLISQALSGQEWAVKMIFNYVEGRPTQIIEQDIVTRELPKVEFTTEEIEDDEEED